ncbi:hypothetical protein [Clostridium cylindrosporum]|uniref:Uncharacterized protein n=1 Tax=Clostridium cylindrosporum DSM 605 TaxID=1121307 RepID=A0A0J8G703_CLOCY|nr:hypothetical protein [Clostridium cylindrosporum]KMT23366.1 hypothetical protein CLCY_8c01030 [Clostridium cylindrosporum DSM 605]
MANDNEDLDYEINKLLNEISKASKKIDHEDGNFGDEFQEFVSDGCCDTLKGGKLASSPCDSCSKKRAIVRAWRRVCNIKYIPPYVDEDCRDFKLALIIEKIEPQIVEKVFKFLIYRVSISEIVGCIDDPEWKVQAESILRANGYYNFIRKEFGNFGKEEILQLLFDVNFCCFDYQNKRTLTDSECVTMLKYYIVYVLRDKIKESIVKISELIELDLEYKIAVIEGEIRYIIKCLLEQLVITPFEGGSYTITNFNKIGSLTQLLEIFNGLNCGKHDQRNDFKHIRDTINKYEKVLRTSFDFLNRKIRQIECLMNQRRFIVGVTGICGRGRFEDESPDIIIPPKPVIILNPRDSYN